MRWVSTLPDRLVLAAALVGTCSFFLPAAADPVNPIKLTVLVWAALALLMLGVARAILQRTLLLPYGLPAAAGCVLLFALTVAAAAAPVGTVAIVGTTGRNSGLLAYASALTLYLAALVVLERAQLKVIFAALLVGGSFTATYGLLQLAGIDAVNWAKTFNPVIAALGNPDFASAYLGICVPAAAWLALRADLTRLQRVLAGGLAVFMLVAAVLSGAVQGPIAAGAGLAVLSLAYSLNLPSRVRRFAITGLGAAAGLTLAAAVLGLRGVGPAAAELSGPSFTVRALYWRCALWMLGERPVLGVGLDSYGSFFPRARAAETTVPDAFGTFTDSAHSVPLQMAAQGGVVLGLAYVLFVATVALCLLLGLRRLDGADRLQLGGLGGAWVATQVQSWVSIDQVPLITVQFVLAGAVVVASGVRCTRLVSWRKEQAPAAQEGRRPKRPIAVVEPSLSVGGRMALGGLVGVALVAAWLAATPLRADLASHDGDVARSEGRALEAEASYLRAAELLPGSARYWAKLAGFRNDLGNAPGALAALTEATERDPYDFDAALNAGRLAEALPDLPTAQRHFARAVELDPASVGALTALAGLAPKVDEEAAAKAAVQRGLDILPGSAALWASLGDLEAALGEPAAARQAYERALALEPGQAAATAGLKALAGPTVGG